MDMTRWTPRMVTRVAVAGAVVVAMSVALGTESSAGAQATDVSVNYTCPFPSGAQRITVRVTGAFPTSSPVGRPIRPRGVVITPTLPQAAIADLSKLDAASVTASARLAVSLMQSSGGATKVDWPGLSAPSTPIPGSGDLRLPASGTVPPATVKAIGGAAFVAGRLTLRLRPRKVDGSATSPAAIPLNCTLEPGQNATLAAIRITGPNDSSTPPPDTEKAAPRSAQQQPGDGLDQCAGHVINTPVKAEAFLAGFSNVNKLNGATLLGRENGQTTGFSRLQIAEETFVLCPPDNRFHLLSSGNLDDNGKPQLPPAKATFLTFGFTPTTATIVLTQAPGTNIAIDTAAFVVNGAPSEETTVTSHLSLRVRDVSVNGVPLDVGPHCGTVKPLDVTLKGIFPFYEVNTGGPLTGTATIPPFSGCGVGENLNPIFTASISGPGNFMKLTQGIPCRHLDEGDQGCDPTDRPVPQT